MNASQTSLLIRLFRLVRVALLIAQGLLTAALVFPVITPATRDRLAQSWSIRLLDVLNISVKVSGTIPNHAIWCAMFVANHISWIDIWALYGVHPMHFIGKSEIRAWPLVGWLAEKSGTLFIERGRRRDIVRVAQAATQALRNGDCLGFFPEGTTTDGTDLLPFKTSLLQSAIDTGAVLWPLAIRYPLADGSPNTAIAYWADVTMMQSLRKVLKQRQPVIELHFCPPLPTVGRERRELAHEVRQIISTLLNLQPRTAPGTAGGLPDAAR